MRNFDRACYHLWHFKKKICQFDSLVIHTLTAQLADQGASYNSSATGFVFLSRHDHGSELLCYTPSCPLENEDRCFNGLKQFDLQVLRSPRLITPSASGLTPGIIDVQSTAGRELRASDGHSFCTPCTITLLTRDKSHRDRIDQRLHCVVHAPLSGLTCKFSKQVLLLLLLRQHSSKSVWCKKGNCLCGKRRQQMKIGVGDEGGTEGFGMQVIEGCDSAKDFSIKAPLCVQRSSGEGCLSAKPGDQSWKTRRVKQQ